MVVMAAWLAARGPQATLASVSAAPDELRVCADPALQAGLERELTKLGLDQAVARHHLAVSLVDLTSPSSPRLAMVNGDDMMYAASLPKIAILLGAFVQAERGELELDKATLASLNRMIRKSSNADATAMLEKVGEERLLEILTSDRYRFYDPATGGGLWVGKSYAKSPAYHRDPLRGLSHAATAYQVARFYYLLDRGLLVSPELTLQMKSALANPDLKHKFVKGLATRPPTHMFRKSGTWRQFHSDSALVEAPRKRYILVGIAEDTLGGEWLEEIAAPLSDLVGDDAADR